MTPEEKILASIPWRCFHCDFITTDPAEAHAHFGDTDDDSEFVPICKWWANMDATEKREQFQATLKDLNMERNENARLRQSVEGLEYMLHCRENDFRGFRPFRNCTSMLDIFQLYDSMEGRALAAEAKLQAHKTRTGEDIPLDM